VETFRGFLSCYGGLPERHTSRTFPRRNGASPDKAAVFLFFAVFFFLPTESSLHSELAFEIGQAQSFFFWNGSFIPFPVARSSHAADSRSPFRTALMTLRFYFDFPMEASGQRYFSDTEVPFSFCPLPLSPSLFAIDLSNFAPGTVFRFSTFTTFCPVLPRALPHRSVRASGPAGRANSVACP